MFCLTLGTAEAVWIATSPDVQQKLLTPKELQQYNHDFVDYYHVSRHSSFAAQVWTNNAWVAAQCLVGGLFFGFLPAYLLFVTATEQLGPAAGYLISEHRGGIFFALILPHGMLELTAVFLAAGAGLRLGWTLIDPGRRTRAAAMAEEGRSTVVLAVGLAFVLLCSGLVEGFVTPSGLPPWLRVAIGAVLEIAFLTYVVIFGRRATRTGLTGDVDADLIGSTPLEV